MNIKQIATNKTLRDTYIMGILTGVKGNTRSVGSAYQDIKQLIDELLKQAKKDE